MTEEVHISFWDRMNIRLIASLLGVAALLFQVVTSQEILKVSVYVWPPGSNIYLGEYVLLHCRLDLNTSSDWRYRWFRNKPHLGPTTNPRHLVSGDSYSITAVAREDAGSYRCQAEQWERNTTSLVLHSQPTELRVSESPPSSLTLTPDSRQFFSGEHFTIQCPVPQANSSGWTLRRYPQGRTVRNNVPDTSQCSPLGGFVSVDKLDACVFRVDSVNSGVYWCEGREGRSNAVNIPVSGSIILRTPASSVFEGDEVVLYCKYRTSSHIKMTFFKNGAKVNTSTSSGPDGVTKMTIENVTRDDEGNYKCASQDGGMESPESWLSVRSDPGNSRDGTAASTSGSWKWIIVSCVLLVLLVLIPATVWLVRRYRYQMVYACNCWPASKENLSAGELPATKHDVTEVQWDLSWMEMSNLLDKQSYPGT